MDIPLLRQVTGGIQALDSFANAFADISKSNFIAQQFQMNEELAKLQSRQALEQGREAQIVSQEKSAELGGEQIAAEAASGADVHTGTPLIIRQQSAEKSGLDYTTIGNNAFLKSLGYRIQGVNDATQGALEKNAGMTKAENQLLGGAEDLFQSKLKAIDYETYPIGNNNPVGYGSGDDSGGSALGSI